MSVFYDNHDRESDQQTDAPPGGSRMGIPACLTRFGRRSREEDGPLWGLSYDRAEGIIHLLLAFAIVGGATAFLSSGVLNFSAAPVVKNETVAAAPAAILPLAATEKGRRVAEDRQPAAVEKTERVEPAPAATLASAIDPRPVAQTVVPPAPASAPEPLSPPSQNLRQSLAVHDEPPPPEAAPAPVASAPAAKEPPAVEKVAAEPRRPAEENSGEGRGHTARCYLKLSGKVQSSGSCLVRHTDEAVIFQFPGKPLELDHAHGRTWVATLGGRHLGRVFKSGACWGARGFYACENG